MPIHVEGHTAWKEVQAVGDFLMESQTHANFFREKLSSSGGDTDGGTKPTPEVHDEVVLQTGDSTVKPTVVARHRHEVTLSGEDVSMLKSGGNVTMTTSENNGHQHTITIKWHENKGYYIALCASTPMRTKAFISKCKDRHPAVMSKVANE